jgi:hypothetical protein
MRKMRSHRMPAPFLRQPQLPAMPES